MAALVSVRGRGAKTDEGAEEPAREGARVAAPAEIAAGALASADAVGLYVHFPFCSVHCPYCDFAVDARSEIPHDRYTDAVIAEIGARAPWFGGVTTGAGGGGAVGDRTVDDVVVGRAVGGAGGAVSGDAGRGAEGPRLVSIYFGGGTPGLWRSDALARVIEAGRAAFGAGAQPDGERGRARENENERERAGEGAGHLAPPLELTVEANPGEVDAPRARAWRAAGVNRVSLGVQSLDDRFLTALGRNHDAAAAPRAVRTVRDAGIDNLSIDLMFALPGQTLDDWSRTVDAALSLEPDHVSAYALTIERGTPFGARARRGELVVPDADLAAAMQELGRDRLAAAGFAQYEVSSYARAGRRAIHNSLYWSGAPYLGVGASASSFRPLAGGAGWRFANPRATETYLRAVEASAGSLPPASAERREAADLENEAVWLALRTTDGLDRARHAAHFGADPVTGRERAVEGCVAAGWLEASPASLRPTATGLLFADEIAARLWR